MAYDCWPVFVFEYTKDIELLAVEDNPSSVLKSDIAIVPDAGSVIYIPSVSAAAGRATFNSLKPCAKCNNFFAQFNDGYHCCIPV